MENDDSRCRSRDLADSSSWNFTRTSSCAASETASAVPSSTTRSSGNVTVTVSLHSDSTGFTGKPASERDLILIWTCSPLVIGMSTWLTLTTSPSCTSSTSHS